MGIEPSVANVIVREHAWRPISGDVILLGRQTMFVSPEHAIGMVRESGLPVPQIDFQAESRTRLAKTSYISDDDFFRLLGVNKIKALDISDYEGADIIHDLTVPIPDRLEGCADFILDGSTLDNVFDPATVLRNVARMLRPGGRLVSVNSASNNFDPYLIPTAHLLLDFFTVNGFADCKVYIYVYGGSDGSMNVFTPNLSLLRPGTPNPKNMTSPYNMAVVTFAEKGADSTWNKSPVQHQYRENWDSFIPNLETIKNSKRPDLARSAAARFLSHPEFQFVNQEGTRQSAIDPIVSPAEGAPTLSAEPRSPGSADPTQTVKQIPRTVLINELLSRTKQKLVP